MRDNISEQILGFLTTRFPQAQIGGSDDIFELGYVNSLFATELVMFVEKTFGITVPNARLNIDNFRTVESMAELVTGLRSGAAVA